MLTFPLHTLQERRRRENVERMRTEESRRAAEARREKEQREIDERDAVMVAERRARDAAAREARLREEAETARRRRELAEAREKVKLQDREMLEREFERLQEEGDMVLEGDVSVQLDGSLRWKRRWFELKDGEISLCKSNAVSIVLPYPLPSSL